MGLGNTKKNRNCYFPFEATRYAHSRVSMHCQLTALRHFFPHFVSSPQEISLPPEIVSSPRSPASAAASLCCRHLELEIRASVVAREKQTWLRPRIGACKPTHRGPCTSMHVHDKCADRAQCSRFRGPNSRHGTVCTRCARWASCLPLAAAALAVIRGASCTRCARCYTCTLPVAMPAFVRSCCVSCAIGVWGWLGDG